MKLVFTIAYFITKLHAVQLAPVISDAGSKYGQDPYLIAAVIKVESRYRRTLCYKGAYGYMQVQIRDRSCSDQAMLKAKWLGLHTARRNIARGTQLMATWERWCKKHHKGHHWLLHYNQGFGVCPKRKRKCKASERIPITKGKVGGYAKRVLHVYKVLKARSRRANQS